jgi:dipeptidyl aminopeptidase/acylaminoacyl peptidase
MHRPTRAIILLAACLACTALRSADQPAVDAAARFGALERVMGAELSPDGKRLAYVNPSTGTGAILYVANLDAGHSQAVIQTDGRPLAMTGCGWSGPERLACSQYGLISVPGVRSRYSPFTRLFGVNTDGTKIQPLGQVETHYQLYARQFDGNIIDWLSGSDNTVLMQREYVPESTTGRRTASKEEGLGVDRLDTLTLKSTTVEAPQRTAARYASDGQGVVRLMSMWRLDPDGLSHGAQTHYYRRKGEREWHELGKSTLDSGITPLGVDSQTDLAYVLRKLDGRQALYSIRLDGSGVTELVLARPDVDVASLVTAGRSGHIIGASWSTEYSHVEYFDPVYRQLARALAATIPKLPLIRFVSASNDEQVILLSASSDVDPGRYYVYDRKTRLLDEVAAARPPLENMRLAAQKPLSYAAADGTQIPAYLTLPPAAESAKGLPAIVMPHGGPAARDEWGFDWLAQFFAHQGYVVLQPNYRGSSGYGDRWFADNGFRSWRLAIGDIIDGGRWLVSQGIADPAKLAIVGWSYGGYAALQANVVEPDLFKAVVAVAPVTDFDMVKDEARNWSNEDAVLAYVGSGPHLEDGSPRRHASAFRAPVLMFHGDMDINVSVAESKAMDAALAKAGKQSELVIYPLLDHGLRDGSVRADLLRRSDAFLKKSLGIAGS